MNAFPRMRVGASQIEESVAGLVRANPATFSMNAASPGVAIAAHDPHDQTSPGGDAIVGNLVPGAQGSNGRLEEPRDGRKRVALLDLVHDLDAIRTGRSFSDGLRLRADRPRVSDGNCALRRGRHQR